jgi:alanine racemase
MELRRMGVKTPIMVLNADENALGLLWDFNLEPAVWSFRLAERLAQEAIRRNSVAAPTPQSALKVHVEFDTGMGRLGFAPDALPAILAYFEQNPCLVPVGVFTHLAAAEDPLADAFTDTQISRFTQVAAELKAHYPTILRHVLNTGGAQRFGFSGFEMVRLGIGIYGLSPVPELQAQLQETASLHTTISQIHNYPAGTTVGYGRAGVLMRDSRIATLPLGYADGIPRRLGEGKIHLLLHGQKCPVVGRICMDMLMIDITDVPQGREGDEVVVFGQQGDARQSLLTLAEAAEAIPYELLTALPDRIRRVYVRE